MEISSLGRPTFGGLASGLDTNALLEGLLEIERIPLARLNSRRQEIDGQRGLMRDLNTKLLALRSAAQELDNRNDRDTSVALEEEFLRYSGSTTDDEVVTVSAGFGASPGDIDVVVDKLAKGSRFFSISYATDDQPVLAAGESISISLNDEDASAIPPVEQTQILVPPEVGDSGLSLQEVRDAINTSPDNGGKIRADVLKISDGNFQLVVASTGTGDSNRISLGGELEFQGPPEGSTPEEIQDFLDRSLASNAEIRLFGSEEVISRESNLIDDALTGIKLQLVATSSLNDDYDPENPLHVGAEADFRKTETVSVNVDTDEVAKGLEKFTSAYNDVMDFIDRQFRFDEGSNTSGPLSGDFTLREVQRELRSYIGQGFSFERNPGNPFAPSGEGQLGGSISSVGIEIVDGGRLSVNKEKLEEALALDATSVREFLSGQVRNTAANQAEIDANTNSEITITPDLYDEGFAQLVASSLERLVRTGDGVLASRDEAFAKRLDEFDVSIDRFESRLGQREETLVARFTSLEQIVSGLQSQQGFLSGLQ